MKVARKLIFLISLFYLTPGLATDNPPCFFKEENHELLSYILTFTDYPEHLAMEQVSRFANKSAEEAWSWKIEYHQINPRDLSILQRKLVQETKKYLTEEGPLENLNTKISKEAKKTIIRDAWIKQGEFYLRFSGKDYISSGFKWLTKAQNAGSSHACHRLLEQFLNRFYLITENKKISLDQNETHALKESKEKIKNNSKKRLEILKNSKPSLTNKKKIEKHHLKLALIEHLESKLSLTVNDSPYTNQLIKKGSLEAAFFKVDHFRYIQKNDAWLLITKAIERGNAKAQLYYASKLLDDNKLEEATNFLTLAASNNNAEALYKLGIIKLLNNHSTKAFSIIKEINQNPPLQHENLSWLLQVKNPQAAQNTLLREALQGQIHTKHLLGMIVLEEDIKAEDELIATAAILGHPDAQYLWGMRLWYKAPQAASRMLLNAALQAQPNALFTSGICRFKNGDFEGAQQFITYAIDLGYQNWENCLIKLCNLSTRKLILNTLNTQEKPNIQSTTE